MAANDVMYKPRIKGTGVLVVQKGYVENEELGSRGVENSRSGGKREVSFGYFSQLKFCAGKKTF